MKKPAFVVLLAALLPLTARAQTPPAPTASTTSAQAVPMTVAETLRSAARRIEAKDLPPSYRAVVLGDSSGGPFSSFGIFGFAMMGSMGGGTGMNGKPDESLLLQLLGAAFVDPDDFEALLEGKRPRIRAYTLDLTSMVASSMTMTTTTAAVAVPTASGATPDAMDASSAPSALSPYRVPMPVFTETWIEAGRISQWSARPDLTRDSILKAFAPPSMTAPAVGGRDAGLSNAKQSALAIMMYSQDYDDHFPAAASTAQAQTITEPYLKSRSVWSSANPNGGRLLYNTSLSKVSGSSLEMPASTLLLWDENAWPDGGRVVAFADGHVKYVSADTWASLWQAEMARRGRRRGSAAIGTTAVAPSEVVAKPLPSRAAPPKRGGTSGG